MGHNLQQLCVPVYICLIQHTDYSRAQGLSVCANLKSGGGKTPAEQTQKRLRPTNSVIQWLAVIF